MASRKKITIVTHSSSFHTDDIFAVATLLLVLEKNNDVTVKRSRDEQIINSADYVVDVGGVYDPVTNRFDHHQEGGAGKRENGVPYASFGLVWKKFGDKLSGSKEIAEKIDLQMVQPVDAPDNGFQFLKSSIPDLFALDIGFLTNIFTPTWKEKERNIDEVFMKLVSYAQTILDRGITVEKNGLIAKEILLDTYNKTEDKRIIFVDDSYPWEEMLSKFPEPLFVVYKSRDKNWSIKGIRDDRHSFKLRKKLPEGWAGKEKEELEKVTGVPGSMFCHNNLFMAVNKTKEGILKMAEIALNS